MTEFFDTTDDEVICPNCKTLMVKGIQRNGWVDCFCRKCFYKLAKRGER